uniref:Uncharacterized protein n=1 Tax=Arundo donax TaxID=35708 RepID=A0A0A9BKL3_ARUDO
MVVRDGERGLGNHYLNRTNTCPKGLTRAAQPMAGQEHPRKLLRKLKYLV